MFQSVTVRQLQDRDIVIVGGGLVGNSLALALSGLGFRLAVVDDNPIPPSPTGVSARAAKALVLSLTSQRFLETLGVWAALAPTASCITTVHVSEQGRFGRVLLRASEWGLPALGFVVDAAQFAQQLGARVRDLPDVKWISGARLSDCQAFKNPLIIAADGTHSLLRAQAGIETTRYDYRQTALVATLRVKQDAQGWAYERFGQAGPIAMLPCGPAQVKCVWILPGIQQASDLCAVPEAAFLAALKQSFGHRLGSFLGVELRTTYPLTGVVAQALYVKRLVLVGNAAATLHPIAAQGFNVAVRDIATLAETVWRAKQAGEAIGDISVLRSYAIQRQGEHNHVLTLTHRLLQSFDAHSLFLKPFRQWGLTLWGITPVLKKWTVEQGLGFQYPLPKLCRGVALCPP